MQFFLADGAGGKQIGIKPAGVILRDQEKAAIHRMAVPRGIEDEGIARAYIRSDPAHDFVKALSGGVGLKRLSNPDVAIKAAFLISDANAFASDTDCSSVGTSPLGAAIISANSRPLAMSQMRDAPSLPPTSASRPSGENETEWTPPVCLAAVESGCDLLARNGWKQERQEIIVDHRERGGRNRRDGLGAETESYALLVRYGTFSARKRHPS